MQKIERRRIADLKPYERNARTHSDEQISQIAASIQEWGWTIPILVDEANGILAGHGRVMAAKHLGIKVVPAIVAKGWSDAQKQAYILADNQLALNAGWDKSLLHVEISGLTDIGFDLGLMGFDGSFLAGLKPAGGGRSDPEHVPELPIDPLSRCGDVWLLGQHRLVCGDSTREDVWNVALGGATPSLVLTDPPYGIGLDYGEFKDSAENVADMAKRWLPLARKASPVVVFSPGVTRQWLYPEPDWVLCWFYGGGQLRSPWGFNCWQPFLAYGKDPSLRNGKGCRPDAFDMNTPANSADLDHPCPKPVALWDALLDRLIFNPAAVVVDCFGGAGTTLISCERKNLKACVIELEPRFIDVSIRRWEQFTGGTAILEGTGETLAQRAQKVAA